MTERKLEDAVEELCENQVKEDTLEDEVLELAQNKDADELNDLPLLYRMEIKKVLEREGHELADQIRT